MKVLIWALFGAILTIPISSTVFAEEAKTEQKQEVKAEKKTEAASTEKGVYEPTAVVEKKGDVTTAKVVMPAFMADPKVKAEVERYIQQRMHMIDKDGLKKDNINDLLLVQNMMLKSEIESLKLKIQGMQNGSNSVK